MIESTVLVALIALASQAAAPEPQAAPATASSTAPGFAPAGALDHDRFSTGASAWKGAKGEASWWWQVRFETTRPVGAILQVQGDEGLRFRNAPRRYSWRASEDGVAWQTLVEVESERRLYRLHRLPRPVSARFLRLDVASAEGEAPLLREVEFYGETAAKVEFPEWAVAVNTTHDPADAAGQDFIRLVRGCAGWEKMPAQHLWLGSFDEAFLALEPRPLCVFLSGNYKDWCEVDRKPWRGVQEVLKNRRVPIWAACGGAQGLMIVQETGVDKEWDCPRCRDPRNPKLPVYTHLGHTGPAKCGDYSKNIQERGKYFMRIERPDPAFGGLSEEFEIIEAHCGQMAYVPEGWVRVVTKGRNALTENQCLRAKGRYIYAAQFHIEMMGTPENSRRIMSNFLGLARKWGGYNPEGTDVLD